MIQLVAGAEQMAERTRRRFALNVIVTAFVRLGVPERKHGLGIDVIISTMPVNLDVRVGELPEELRTILLHPALLSDEQLDQVRELLMIQLERNKRRALEEEMLS